LKKNLKAESFKDEGALVLSSGKQLAKVEKPKEEMNLIEIINDRRGGKLAPSEIEKKKLLKERKKSGESCKSEKPKVEV